MVVIVAVAVVVAAVVVVVVVVDTNVDGSLRRCFSERVTLGWGLLSVDVYGEDLRLRSDSDLLLRVCSVIAWDLSLWLC